jgi:hypothetical protein
MEKLKKSSFCFTFLIIRSFFFHLSAHTSANGDNIIDGMALAIKIKLTVAAPPSSLTVTHNIEMKNIAEPVLETSLPKNKSKKSLFFIRRFKP